MMFFEPREILTFSNGKRGFSLAQFFLGKRIEGVGGNAAAYKWMSRITNEGAKINDENITKFIGLTSYNTDIAAFKFDEMFAASSDRLLNLLPWYAFLYGADHPADGYLSELLPRTIDLVKKLDVLSKLAEHFAKENDINALSHIVSNLPLTSNFVPDWVCERLKTGNDKNWDAIFFPLRVILLFATLRHMSDEAVEEHDPDRAELRQVFWSRDESSGNPRPFRPCFERLVQISGEGSFDNLFKQVFTGSAQTRIREGRKFMAAPPNEPKAKACSKIVRSAKKAFSLSPDAVGEINRMFFYARMLTGIYNELNELVNDLPGIEPNAILDEWGVEWRLDSTEDANILRQMDAVMAHLHSSSD